MSLAELYRLLGDEARLRLLRVLARERLNVSELTAVLALAQSGVSRHLKLLKEAGLVREERDGGFSYYRIASFEGDGPVAELWPVLANQLAATADDPVARADLARLQEVRRLRRERFEPPSPLRRLEPGRSWAAWARALGLLMPAWTVADLACGDGYLAIEIARWARRVVAVDRSAVVLRRARALARRQGVANIVWKRGEIEHLPLAARSVDVALLSQALHHAEVPARALAEAVRITRPGGRVLVMELRAHEEHWVRERLGDRWLGFRDEELARLMRQAGLERVVVRPGAHLKGDPFTVLIASGSVPGRDGR
jgi:SAM-dependent methyltransferase